MATNPFFTASDWLGVHAYFKARADAEAFAAANGGELYETTPGTVWRITRPGTAAACDYCGNACRFYTLDSDDCPHH